MSRRLLCVVTLLAVQLLVRGERVQADNPPSEGRHLSLLGKPFDQVPPRVDNNVVDAAGGKSSSSEDDKPCRSAYDDDEVMGGKSSEKENDKCKAQNNDDTWWIVLICVTSSALILVTILSVVAYHKCKRSPTRASRYCGRTPSLNSVRPEPYKSNDKDDSYIRPPAGTPPPQRTPPPQNVWSVQGEGGVNPAAGPPPYLAEAPKYSSIA